MDMAAMKAMAKQQVALNPAMRAAYAQFLGDGDDEGAGTAAPSELASQIAIGATSPAAAPVPAGGLLPGMPTGMPGLGMPTMPMMNPMMNPMMMQTPAPAMMAGMLQQQMMQTQMMHQQMMAMQSAMQLQQGQASASAGSAVSFPGVPGGLANIAGSKLREEEIDPDVLELCDYFNIEERYIKRLNEAISKRRETKAGDLEKVYDRLERAKEPTKILRLIIGDMEAGTFIGKIKPDKDVERVAAKFKLDDRATRSLAELLFQRTREGDPERGVKDLATIEQHLRYSKRPNPMCISLVGRLMGGEVGWQIKELPSLTEAEKVMEKYKLDDDAKIKLREILEKRHADHVAVLEEVKLHLDHCSNTSAMLSKIAGDLLHNRPLAPPVSRARANPNNNSNHSEKAAEKDSNRERSRSRGHTR